MENIQQAHWLKLKGHNLRENSYLDELVSVVNLHISVYTMGMFKFGGRSSVQDSDSPFLPKSEQCRKRDWKELSLLPDYNGCGCRTCLISTQLSRSHHTTFSPSLCAKRMPFGGAKQNALELPYLWSPAGDPSLEGGAPGPVLGTTQSQSWSLNSPFQGLSQYKSADDRSLSHSCKGSCVYLIPGFILPTLCISVCQIPIWVSQPSTLRSLLTAAFHAWKLSPVPLVLNCL